VQTLLLAVRGTRYEALYLLAVTTGLREGELLGLKWSDLDWITRNLSIQRQLQRLSGQGMVFSEPKSASGRRVIALGSATIEKLREHYKHQQLERLAAGERWIENDLIFPTIIGTPNEGSNLIRSFKSLLRASNLPIIRFHDLRHTAATLMLQQGIHPKVVQERLGHSQISLTLDTYSHVLPNMQEEAAEKIDELIIPVALRLR
jgi:integrase